VSWCKLITRKSDTIFIFHLNLNDCCICFLMFHQGKWKVLLPSMADKSACCLRV
jgi:hypothetical protein